MKNSILPCLLAALCLGRTPAIVAAETDAAEIYDNVVIVLDCSGSMAGKMPGSGQVKMDAAKSALKQVLGKLPPTVHVGVLVFSGANVSNKWIYPLGPRNDAQLTRAIDQPQPGGDTPLGAYIKKGADRLLEERTRQRGYGTYRLLLVTDGEAQDQNLVDRYAPEVIARGIIMDVIGVAMNQRHTLATKAHSYRAANDPTGLQKALAEVFAEVGTSANDTTSAEMFASIAPLPAEVAAAAIQALATTRDHPIGERPPPKPAPGATSVPPSTSTAPPAAPPPAGTSTPPQPVTVGRGSVASGGPFKLLCLGLFVLFLIGMIRRAVRASRR